MTGYFTELSKDSVEYDHWDLDKNLPCETGFCNALSLWSWMQCRPTTTNEAAMTFNCTREVTLQAVEAHPWLYLDGDIIEHEGE